MLKTKGYRLEEFSISNLPKPIFFFRKAKNERIFFEKRRFNMGWRHW
jgi:hypothetical protein